MVWVLRAAVVVAMAGAGAVIGMFAVGLIYNAVAGPGAPEMPGVQGAIWGYLVGAPLGGVVGIVAGVYMSSRWIGRKGQGV